MVNFSDSLILYTVDMAKTYLIVPVTTGNFYSTKKVGRGTHI